MCKRHRGVGKTIVGKIMEKNFEKENENNDETWCNNAWTLWKFKIPTIKTNEKMLVQSKDSLKQW